MQNSKFLTVAKDIAKESGRLLLEYYGNIDSFEYKGVGDVVTEADKESEKLINNRLKTEFPFFSILGEEYGLLDLQSDYCWATDPLDGTSNYASKLPIFSVSIALLYKGSPIIGVVYDPNQDFMYCAAKSEGAFLNEQRIQVSNRTQLESISLFGAATDIIETLPSYLSKVGKVRSLGSAAIHLSNVAAGYFDGCLDINTKLWDVAAGALILQEAGGTFTDHSGEPIFPLEKSSPAYHGNRIPFLATNGKIHQQTLQLIATEKERKR
ncbi:TPA: inositol monophosphatase [Candidatus Poribacteria bacterium]|nr:inositol monophosphatase [Candidatus Poribacteria bacterium]